MKQVDEQLFRTGLNKPGIGKMEGGTQTHNNARSYISFLSISFFFVYFQFLF